MKVRTEKLCDVAEINPKLTRQPAPTDRISFVPMSAVDAVSASTHETEGTSYSGPQPGYTPFLNTDLLIAKITPCFENGKIAEAKLNYDIGFGSTEFHIIRPLPEKADRRYILHFLRQQYVRIRGELKMTGSGGQRRVPEKFLRDIQVPIPPLSEQRRIAAVLDQAEALRAKRRQTLNQLDELTHSLFLNMFGDLDYADWSMSTIADVAAPKKGSIRTGPFGSQLLHEEFVDDGIAVLGIDNAVNNEFQWKESRFITDNKYQQLSRYTVFPGDVIITIMGTCGRCSVVPDTIGMAINTKHLCCITLDQNKCLPDFIHAYFLRHPTAQRHLKQKAKGAIMSGLNMGIIKALPVPVPPLDLQREFARRVELIEQAKERQRAHLAELDSLFASLQSRAFRGEL